MQKPTETTKAFETCSEQDFNALKLTMGQQKVFEELSRYNEGRDIGELLTQLACEWLCNPKRQPIHSPINPKVVDLEARVEYLEEAVRRLQDAMTPEPLIPPDETDDAVAPPPPSEEIQVLLKEATTLKPPPEEDTSWLTLPEEGPF